MSQKQTPTNTNNELNIREEVEKYLRYWPWFLICAFLALGYAYLELRQTTPVYSSSATIVINSQGSEMGALSDLGLISGMKSNSIENEIGVLRSRQLMERVVKALDLNIRYFDEQKLRSPELYRQSPFTAKFLVLDEEKMQNTSARSFKLNYKGGDRVELTRSSDQKIFEVALGQPVDLGFAQVIIEPNELVSGNIGTDRPITISFELVRNIASSYRNNLSIRMKEENSSLIELGINDPVRSKAEDVLDQLVVEYNREAIEDKNLVAINTAKFIEERLMIINEELDSVETGKVNFKESNRLLSLEAESGLVMSSVGQTRGNQQELDTQIELAEAMLDYMESSSLFALLPANLGLEEGAVNEEINQYNELVLERNQLLNVSTDKNPVVARLNQNIEELRGSVQQSLNRMMFNLRIQEKSLDRQTAAVGSEISAVPSKEKQFRGIERQQQIKETLYLFLLQKREENSLAMAITEPKAKVVDSALSSGGPVSPNPRNMYLTALVVGLGIPFGVIYLKNLLNNKVRSQADIENMAEDIPLVGEIPKIGKNSNELIQVNDRSVLAESFRILHTNLQYLLVNSGGKTEGISILITSAIKGEGKTFTAFNLAITLANTGKKVIIVGGDLRNPQLQRYEPESKNFLGVCDYLVNKDLQLENLIKRSTIHPSLDILASGRIPPNPSELLRQEKAKQMFKELESLYDYIIIDSAPAMLVADTFLINQYADLTLFMVRAGYTEKKLLNFPVDAKKKGKLSEVSFVLNNVEVAHFGYGNKYGYAYGEENTSFWDRFKNKAAMW